MNVRQTEVILQLVKFGSPSLFRTNCCTNLVDSMAFSGRVKMAAV